MKSLYDHYKRIKESYYSIRVDLQKLFSGNASGRECYNFINDHFTKGNKKQVFSIPESYLNKYREFGKHQHTVSLYLMGLLFRSHFCLIIKEKMQNLFDVSEWYAFEYTWYLTCLYHDVTSSIERDSGYDYSVENVHRSKLFDFDYLIRFPPETYINYLNFRKSAGNFEHGIIAGTALFDALEQSFYLKTEGHDWSKDKKCVRGNLCWRKEHLPHFAYISDAICCHNIWLADKNDLSSCEKYRKFGLGNLIVNTDADKLNLSQYPLQYILCLLDTIEPIKRFANISADEVLKNIFIDILPSKIIIGWSQFLTTQPQFFEWLNPITTLHSWMNINISTCYHNEDKCCIEIRF